MNRATGQRRPLQVLLVEDEELLAEAEETALALRGHSVTVARSAVEALQLPEHDVVVSDVRLPLVSGFQLVKLLRDRGDRSAVVFTSGGASPEDYRRAMRLGAFEFLAKPYGLDELADTVEAAAIGGDARLPRLRAQARFAADAAGCEEAARQLAAWLLEAGFGPAGRMRAVSACAQLIGAGTPGAGELALRVTLKPGSARVDLSRPEPAGQAPSEEAERALEWARALSEELVHTTDGRRSCVRLRFDERGAETEAGPALDDLDYLDARALPRLVAAASDGESSLDAVPRPVAALLERLSEIRPPLAVACPGS